MHFKSGFGVHKNNSHYSPISTGDVTLDKLLNGGFHRNLVYLLYGDEKVVTNILLYTSVIVQQSSSNGGMGEGIKVAFVDGKNRFNPYNISKFSVIHNLSPRKVLENIVIARAFTWDQMVELLENQLAKLEEIKVVLISGITDLLQNYEKQTFEDLLKMIGGIKKILSKTDPLIIITAPLHKSSFFRPKGGKILSHFGNVLVLVNNEERYVEYTLVQHPFLSEHRIVKWKTCIPKRNLAKRSRNTTLNTWIE
ncbi:MAG: hypothetical protein JXA99_05715 [Candidatus Lokiarchaeota archaeon]|nr:hypothetical protein [Candidatus Lokiarchaeota archaeon]